MKVIPENLISKFYNYYWVIRAGELLVPKSTTGTHKDNRNNLHQIHSKKTGITFIRYTQRQQE
jgi:hypothetical protein